MLSCWQEDFDCKGKQVAYQTTSHGDPTRMGTQNQLARDAV